MILTVLLNLVGATLIFGQHQNHNHKLGEEDEHHYYKRTIPYVHPEENINYPLEKYDLGQITAIDIINGYPVLFHRGVNIWDRNSFNDTFYYQEDNVIQEDTIVVLDNNGIMANSFGAGLFYMPHGLSVQNGDIWVTDVALHQVFKFPANSKTPSFILGKRFEPGTDNEHFCQPTSVQVSTAGIIFVADGYCNSRIMKYDKDGKFLGKFGVEGTPWQNGQISPLAVPHSLSLMEDEDCLCIADREHNRVICVNAGLKDNTKFGEIKQEINGIGHVYGISFDGNERLYAVNGGGRPESHTGLTIDLKHGQVMDLWNSYRSFLSPHDVAVDVENGFVYVVEIGPYRVTQFKI